MTTQTGVEPVEIMSHAIVQRRGKNFALGTLTTNCPRMGRIAEVGSLSLHSSKASITMAVVTADSAKGWTISLFI